MSLASTETAFDPAIKLFEDKLPPPPGPSIDPKIIRGWADGMKGGLHISFSAIYLLTFIPSARMDNVNALAIVVSTERVLIKVDKTAERPVSGDFSCRRPGTNHILHIPKQ